MSHLTPKQHRELVTKFNKLLNENIVNVAEIKHLIWKEGLPNDNEIRPLVWKLLLGYYTPNRNEWQKIDDYQSHKYPQYVARYMPERENIILNNSKIIKRAKNEDDEMDAYPIKNSSITMNEKEERMISLIEKDIARTVIGVAYNSDYIIRHDFGYRRILYLIHKVLPTVEYVQGMNDICNVFYVMLASSSDDPNYLDIEAQTFGMMLRLFTYMCDWFDMKKDETPTGIVPAMEDIEKMIKENDKQIYNKLVSNGIDSRFYIFSWLTLFFCHDFPRVHILTYWDYFFLDLNTFIIVKATCCGVVISLKNQLLNLDMPSMLGLLQNIPYTDPMEHIKIAKKVLGDRFDIRKLHIQQSNLNVKQSVSKPQPMERSKSSGMKTSSQSLPMQQTTHKIPGFFTPSKPFKIGTSSDSQSNTPQSSSFCENK